MKLRLLVLFTLLVGSFAAVAQRVVTGSVSDGKTKETLAGVTLLVTGTNTGTSTQADGTFSIKVPNDAATITISYIGYAKKVVSIEGKSKIDINLDQDAAQLGEVVVTALGIEGKKSQLSYATQRLAAKDLNASRNGDLAQQLSGQVPGLSIGTNSSSGVSSSRITLRGESSLNIAKNQPLIVLDGVVISNNLDATGQSEIPIDYGNGLTDINPDDILDVSVLKGPKAAALYGTRAANGALVIRTKSGREKDGVGVTFTTGVAVEEVTRFWDVQKQYGGGFDNVFRSDWGGNYGAPATGQPISQVTYLLPRPDATPFNFKLDREGFFNQGMSTNNNLAISSSNEKMYARVSVGYLNNKGFVPNTDYNKTNVGLRMGALLTEKLSVDVSANYSKSGSKNLPVLGAGGQGIINSMIWGMGNFDYNDYTDYWVPGKEGIQQNYFLSWANNPFLIVNENLNGFNRNRVFGNIKADYKFNDHFSFFARIGTDGYDDRRRSRRPSGQNGFALGMYREQNVRFQETNADFLLSYIGKIGGVIGVKADVGANQMNQSSFNGVAQTNALGIRGVYNLGNAADRPVLRQTDATKRINSVYGSARFDYENKIYLDVTGRNDWSSTLPLDNNSFFYPSVGLSTVLSEMIKMPKAISFAQIRTSWAATGNDTDPLLTERVFAFGTLPASVTNTPLLTNAGLRPERTAAFEIGTELRFLADKIGIEANYYSNVTTDQILQVPVSQSSGAVSSLINAGKIRNSGVEVLLKLKPITTNDFTWDMTVAWARNRGMVEELAPGVSSYVIGQGPSGGTVEARVGGQMGDIYGRGFARSPQGDIIYDRVTVNGNVIVRPRVGSAIIKVGNYNPNWTMGFINSFNYKNINLRVFLDYRKGGSLYTQTGALLYRSGVITETLVGREAPLTPVGVLQNTDGTFTPNTITTTGQDYYRSYYAVENVEANTYDATFLKVREVSLGVNLKNYLRKLPVASANISFFGRNLFVKSTDALRHFNPESFAFNNGVLVPGFEAGQLPTTRTYGFNLTVGFKKNLPSKTMKNTFLYSLILLVGLTLGCTNDFENINKNTNAPTQTNVGSLLPSVIFEPINPHFLLQTWLTDQVMQYVVRRNDNQLDAYDFATGQIYFSGIWQANYAAVRNANDMIATAESLKLPAYVAAGMILKAYYMASITELFIDAPYAEAGKGADNISPAYSNQQAIYAGVLKDLDAANALLVSPAAFTLGGDVLFKGDISRWKKMANSLRLRYLLRVSNKDATAAAEIKKMIDNPATFPIITSNADAAIYDFSGVIPDASAVSTLLPASLGGVSPSKRLVEFLRSNNDPRLDFFVLKPVNAAGFPNHEGVTSGTTREAAQSTNGNSDQNTSTLTRRFTADRGLLDYAFITHAEVQFILAEARMKNWIGTGTAKEYYEKGITASFEYWKLTTPAGFLAQPKVAFDGTMAQLMDQKWMSYYMVNTLEAWGEQKRTGLPALVPGPLATTITGGKIPTRAFYPTLEQSINGANYKAASASIGGDVITAKHWYQN